jgi:uncharacterized protein DUF4260
MNTKTLIKLEELTLVLLAFYLFLTLDYAWWWFPLLFFIPDVSMIGYLINSQIGAVTYNFIHHKALAILLYLFGGFTQLPVLQLAGLVMLGHSSLDRALGFELQQTKEFKK